MQGGSATIDAVVEGREVSPALLMADQTIGREEVLDTIWGTPAMGLAGRGFCRGGLELPVAASKKPPRARFGCIRSVSD